MMGAPTFFLTLSAADKQWPEVLKPCFKEEHGREPTDEELEALQPTDRNILLRKHPAKAAFHFHQRVKTFFQEIVKDDSKPLGHVYDLFLRYEWQQRGNQTSLAS